MKKQQKGSIGINEIVLAVVLIGFSAFVIWRVSAAEQAVNQSDINSTSGSSTTTLRPNVNTDTTDATLPADGVEAVTENQQTIDLVAVNNYNANGTASRAFGDQTFVHELIIEADSPADGKFYEGWLVGPSVVSTGKLVNEGGRTWSLTFVSTDMLNEHNEVVVTEETTANGLDGIPEDHILEGMFAKDEL